MDTPWAIFSKVELFSLVFIRMGALFAALPVFGSRLVPVPIKVLFVCAISWALVPFVPLPSHPPADTLSWAAAAIKEGLIGLSMGWLVNLCLAAVPFAGQLLGYQMGFGIAMVMDPLGQQQMAMVAQFMYIFALWLFFALDGHHLLISGVFESFRWAAPGTAGLGSLAGSLGMEAGNHLFRSALLLAAPVLLVMFFVQVAFGIVARTVPQMNVFIVAVPLQIAIGLLAMAAAFGFFTPWLTGSLGWLKRAMLTFASGF